MNKDTYYFSHDYNARNDSKIKKLLSKHNYLGYGIFWAIIEDLYNNANALPTDYDSIAFDLRTTSELVKSIITDFDLFVFEGNFFGSASVERRLEERNSKSVKARESAFKRWNKDANALPTDSERIENGSEGNAIKERKGNKRKGKEKEFIPPSEIDVVSYFKANGYTEQAGRKAYLYYSTAKWIDSKNNKIISWKQKMIGVWFKEENKEKSNASIYDRDIR